MYSAICHLSVVEGPHHEGLGGLQRRVIDALTEERAPAGEEDAQTGDGAELGEGGQETRRLLAGDALAQLVESVEHEDHPAEGSEEREQARLGEAHVVAPDEEGERPDQAGLVPGEGEAHVKRDDGLTRAGGERIARQLVGKAPRGVGLSAPVLAEQKNHGRAIAGHHLAQVRHEIGRHAVRRLARRSHEGSRSVVALVGGHQGLQVGAEEVGRGRVTRGSCRAAEGRRRRRSGLRLPLRRHRR
jgi:hypothetical protein